MSLRRARFCVALLAWLVAAAPSLSQGVSLAVAPPAARDQETAQVASWFREYDRIRRQAQMTAAERGQARRLLNLARLVDSAKSRQDQAAGEALLNRMIARYRKAQNEMSALTPTRATLPLHRGYQRYFRDATSLFATYLKVLQKPLTEGANNGGLLSRLHQEKHNLEQLDRKNKALDKQTRKTFGITAFESKL